MSFIQSLSTSRRTFLASLLLLCVAGIFAPSAPAADSLAIYSGRSERLIKPVLDAFTAKTDIQIELLSSGTTELSDRLVEAVTKGQVPLGIINHYYLYRHLAAQPGAPIAALMPDQQECGIGVIIDVGGVCVIKTTKRLESARLQVEFLVAQAGQQLFADLNKEYQLHQDVKADPALADRKSFRAALVPLAKLAELREPTLTLIEQVDLR